jgi:hypothetical protein
VPATEPATFSLVVVPKHQRRIVGFDETVLSLYATVNAVVGEKAEWQSRPLDLGQFLVIVANHLAMRWRRHRLMNYRCRPRVFKLRRNAVQNASSSLSPTSKPRTSRRPSAAAPVATTTVWDTTQ